MKSVLRLRIYARHLRAGDVLSETGQRVESVVRRTMNSPGRGAVGDTVGVVVDGKLAMVLRPDARVWVNTR